VESQGCDDRRLPDLPAHIQNQLSRGRSQQLCLPWIRSEAEAVNAEEIRPQSVQDREL
jgi:hypothetical protein